MRKFLMLVMAVVLSLSSAFATTVYCKMTQSWWTTDGAAVAVHYWGGASAGTTWPGVRMTSVSGEEGMWSYDVPSDVTGLVFVRVNGSGDVTDWGAKTKDLTLPTDGKNLFTITSSSAVWGNPGCDGEWSTYAPAETTVTYTALTAAPTTGNWAGQYLIVFADNKAHATVSGSDLAATSDALTITAGEIELNATDAYYVMVEPFAEGYSIKLPSGKYMVCGKNKISQSATPVALSLNYTTSGVEIVSTDENEYTLYCNTSGTNKYYRAYTPKTASNYALPTLYRTGDEAPALQTLYFVNVLDWTKVNAFVWPATGDAYKPWSGEAMYKTADQVNGKDIYAYRFPVTFVNAIFNNGSDQTADLVWDAAKPYFVPGAKNGEGKYEGTWYASTSDIPTPKYYIAGSMTNWKDNMVQMVPGNDDSLSVDIALIGDYYYEFKVVKVYGTDTTWYGNTDAATMEYGNSTGWWLKGNVNVGLKTTGSADYKFIFKANENNEISVVIPKDGGAVVPEEPTGLLNGVFSIAENGTAKFARGNLQYNYGANKWYFAEKQYDALADANLAFGDVHYSGAIDMFSWSCESSQYGLKTSNHNEDYSGAFVDWGGLFAGAVKYSTLTKEEWNYLMARKQGDNKLWTMMALIPTAGSMDTIIGLTLLPDNWVMPAEINFKYGFYDLDVEADLNANTFTYADWAKMEAAGAVFLPCAGSRTGFIGNTYDGTKETTVVNPKTGWYCWFDNLNIYGYYWLNSTTKAAFADYVILPSAYESPAGSDEWHYAAPAVWTREQRRGNSVRLVEKTYQDIRPKREIVLVPGETKAADPSMFVFAWTQGKQAFDALMTIKKVGDDTIYTAQVPEELDSLIFVRAAHGVAAWSDLIWSGEGKNVWNQTADQVITCDSAFFAGWDNDYFKVTWCPKPVIVESLNLVPNMWSEAGAKMAAWVWGEGLAGAWTPFFAGEGDTLSVKIDEQADSVIFVRFASEVAAPAWEATIWNRVKDEEIDHVGLTYTITAWGDEGVSVGQWAPYEPVVPGKYYITGDSALVVDAGLTADKAWNADAIKADADTTVLNLKAGVDYKLKVTVDGTWDTALGYDALSEKTEGLIKDADGNICFKLAEAGAVQVVYFKEGDVVTFKVLGKFYIKPVIVETLNLVPNMWSEANAKMAAWVWGEGLAGAWTPFFAGEGDTLSVKIDEQADSVIFVRFASEVAAPAWEATIWNRVKDEEIDHVGLTYTITAWGDEGVSVGQWTPYEPVVPGKYYITGDSALVVDAGLAADKAWNADAIKADADTTVLNLKAGVEYKLKVTVDGTWDTALGFDALSEKTEGLIADADGNICFKLAETGAVQVIYFKEGDVVTFKVLGNFYIKPVIVETLNLVPNMWSEAGAKMAAWVWGEGLAGAWTPFFAGEGDTLSVKIDEQADSVIFVRFASEVANPDWKATIWNRVKDEEIDHVGLTYTITAWGDEGVSVGQWTPYEPAGGCDWDNLPWLGSTDAAYAEQFKVCVGDPKPTEVVNIQKPGFATEIGIYITFPSADFGPISLSEGQYAIQGAGMLLYVSAFTAKETEVSVVCENVEYVFTVYNDKGGEPVCEGKYGLKVGEAVVEFAKNEAQTEWTEYYKQDVELIAGDVIVLYNICEDQTFAAKVAGYEGLTPLVGGDGWTVTETAKYDFYLKLIFGADELYVVKQGDDPQPGDKVYTIAGDEALVGVNWDPAATVNDMTKQADGSYTLVKKNVVLEAKAYEYKVVEGHSWSGWQIPEQGNQTLAITAAGTYDVTFTLDAALTTLTANAVSVGPMPDPTVEVWGSMNEWSQGLPLTLSADKTTATITANIEADRYEFKIKVNGEWRSNAQTFTRQNNSAVGITIDEPGNMIFVADMTGNYTVTWTLATSALSIVYPTTPTAVENLVAPANELRKVMIDGKLYILRDGKIYSVQGQLIR